MNPREKLGVLKGSFEKKVISKKEYEGQKVSIDKEIKDFDKKAEDIRKNQPPEEGPKKSSEKILIIAIAVIVLLFIAFFAYNKFTDQEREKMV